VLGASLVVLSAPAFAEQYNCVFNEPPVTVTIDTNLGTGSFARGKSVPTILERLVYEQMDEGTMRIDLFRDKEQILLIDSSHNGNDGVTDRVYPYEGILTNGVDAKPAKTFGGCESAAQKSTCPAGGNGC
jgi:hypothetical protein